MRRLLPGLTASWRAGAWLYGALGRLDAWHGTSNWLEGLGWLADYKPDQPISEIQYWGHGTWGCVRVAGERLDARAFEPTSPLYERLSRLKARLTPGNALLWLRTCEAFGTARGHAFALTLSRFFGCEVAGHTYVIGPWQSGLHRLRPGEAPAWPVDEGLPLSEESPRKALWSKPRAPNTITCWHGHIPARF
jgi:hypothetical protein